MIKTHASIAIAALLLSGAAFAVPLQPAAGNVPMFHTRVTTAVGGPSRAEVLAQAIRHPPAAGNMSAQAAPVAGGSDLTRAEVRAEAVRHPPAAGNMDA